MKSLMILAYSSIALLLLTSCEKTVTYAFQQRNLNAADLGRIDFRFRTETQGSTARSYRLDLRSSPRITVAAGVPFAGLKEVGSAKIFLYPDFDQLPQGGKIELFVYAPIAPVSMGSDRYRIEKAEGVIAYFIDFVRDSRVLTAVSKTNTIDLAARKRPKWNQDDIFGEYDCFVVLRPEVQFTKDALRKNGLSAGYIVKSSIDGTQLWLN